MIIKEKQIKEIIDSEHEILEYSVWGTNVHVKTSPSTISGLSKIPQMINFDNNNEWPVHNSCPVEVSDCNYNTIMNIAKNYMTDGIVEIGVYNGWKIGQSGHKTTTHALLFNKPDNIPYLGIDIEDKSFLNDDDKKVHTLISDTRDFEKVKSRLKEIGIEKISILLIDGDHSLNMVINDWKYTELLSDNGIVIFHDTNYHPPTLFIDFIDRNMYDVIEHCRTREDYGLTIAYRKNSIQ